MGNVIAAFSEEDVERLTKVTRSQLRYWNRTDFFSPSYGRDLDSALGRIYSFKDIISLKVLNLLRNTHGVPLPHLRQVGEMLSQHAADKWTGIKLRVMNKRVVWNEPGTDKPQEIVSGQYVVSVIDLGSIVSDLEQEIKILNTRHEDRVGQIEKLRSINHNAAMISGTRIPVRAIKRFSAAGYTPEQILSEYPDLTERDIFAALEYGEIRSAA